MKSVLSAACAGLLLSFGGAMAQPAGAPANPGRPDVKQVGDWFVRCFPIESPSPCDMFQELDNQETKQRVLSISMAYVPSIDRHALQIRVPLEISIPKGVVLKAGSFSSPVLKYRRCDREGCYVETPVDNSLVESLSRASGEGGKIAITADTGKSFELNFFLKGFTAAHDEMVSLARAKAKAISKPADAAAPATP